MVSVITVNYNNTQVTLELLESLYAHEGNAVEVIVVDNASRENPEQKIKENFPQVKFIRSDRNLGFAGGNNLGIAQATGDYLFFVNNDTAFTAPIIAQLVTVLEEDKTIGAVCPILVYPSGKIQFAGFTPINAWTGRNKCLTSPASAELKVNTSYAHGAAFMISRTLVKQIGHIHKESQTVGSFSELKSYFMSRNRLLFMRRNYSRASLAFFWFYFLLVASPMHIVRYLKAGNWNCVRAHLAGIFWNIRWSVDSLPLGYKYNHLNRI